MRASMTLFISSAVTSPCSILCPYSFCNAILFNQLSCPPSLQYMMNSTVLSDALCQCHLMWNAKSYCRCCVAQCTTSYSISVLIAFGQKQQHMRSLKGRIAIPARVVPIVRNVSCWKWA
ncbi:hypothetical protein FGO68_gene11300 [Halteria grandinella]|uniref:Secreted protein n=1 Tax=Halteria grandinella TaxID=5974 RepID=A0A8J8NM16_HALGN|nr:hypothetical protein FGO68_gene11300 [Halteria grandinella]